MDLDSLIRPIPLQEIRSFSLGLAGELISTIITITSWPYFIGEGCKVLTLRDLRTPGFKPLIAADGNLAGVQKIACTCDPHLDKFCYYYISEDHKLISVRRAVDIYRYLIDWMMSNLPFGRRVF